LVLRNVEMGFLEATVEKLVGRKQEEVSSLFADLFLLLFWSSECAEIEGEKQRKVIASLQDSE
jgi:hypothetical protein